MKEAGYEKSLRDKIKKLRAEYQKVKDKNKQTGNNCRTWKYTEAIDKILGGRPAIKPPLVIDTLNSSAETVGTDDDQESKKVDNDSVEDSLEDIESVSGTDISSSSDGNSKTVVSKEKPKKPKKHTREDQLQSIMSGIMTQILDLQVL